MSNSTEVTNAAMADGVAALNELALNLHWSWNHAADELWMALDEALWATTQNPWVILQTVSKDQMNALLSTPALRKRLDDLVQQNRDAYKKKGMVSGEAPRFSALVRRLLQHGVHAQRGPSHLLRWSRQRCRGSDEGGQWPGCARGRHWSALWTRIFSTGLR